MARGDKEQRCLERVRKYIFPNGSYSVEEADTALIHSSAFGLTQEDWGKFCGILAMAKPNANPNEFPDFISGDSALEHFEISATEEGRRGSAFRRKRESFLKSARAPLVNASVSDEPNVLSHAFIFPDRIHALLLVSLAKNVENHIESLEAYATGHKVDTSIFVIEHREFGLAMFENVYGDIGGGRTFGDIREQQKFSNYRLSRDAEALKLLYEYENLLDTVIFVGVENIEIIKLTAIPDMLTLMPWPFVVAAGPTIESHTFLPVIQTREMAEGQIDYD